MTAVFLSALFFTLLGAAYVRGYDYVKRHSPQNLPQFYLILATIRIILVATVVAIYVIMSRNHQEAVSFAMMFLAMYVVMMVVTLILKH